MQWAWEDLEKTLLVINYLLFHCGTVVKIWVTLLPQKGNFCMLSRDGHFDEMFLWIKFNIKIFIMHPKIMFPPLHVSAAAVKSKNKMARGKEYTNRPTKRAARKHSKNKRIFNLNQMMMWRWKIIICVPKKYEKKVSQSHFDRDASPQKKMIEILGNLNCRSSKASDEIILVFSLFISSFFPLREKPQLAIFFFRDVSYYIL